MRGRAFISAVARGLSQLIAPRLCMVCGQTLVANEEVMCLACRIGLPRTRIHLNDFNEIHQRLGHHAKVDRAAAWFHYKPHTEHANMLVEAKYGNKPYIAKVLGRMYATELMRDNFFDGIEVLIPMPMYWVKRALRGYNQAVEICEGISEVTSLPVVKAIKAARSHGTQSHHNKAQRYQKINGTMALSDATSITGKSILLVDDIITTGASCREALRVISQAQPRSINVLALGMTMRL